MERRKLAALIIVIAVASVSALSVLLYTGFFDSEYNHGPIRITSNQEFTKENGVTGGSGTEEDPYIIEGWRMGPSDVELGPEAAVILVKDVSRHFVIIDIHITGPNVFGVMLKNCHNGTIQNSTFILCYQGIDLHDCSGCAVRGNNISSCTIGMAISSLDTTVIEDNQLHREIDGYPVATPSGWGLRIGSQLEEVTVSDNRFQGMSLWFDSFVSPDNDSLSGLTITESNTVDGKPIRFFEDQEHVALSDSPVGQVIMFNCKDATISQLEINEAGVAILLHKVEDCVISGCSLNNSWMLVRDSTNVAVRSNMICDGGIRLSTCSHVVVNDNHASSPLDSGLDVHDCDNVTIHGNLIHECSVGIQLRGENITVSSNVLLSNGIGILADNIYNLQVFYNDFIDNNRSAETSGGLKPMFFHNETSCMGNYWSDYNGIDEDDDGIGDTPYVIESTGQDDYPLMAPVNS